MLKITISPEQAREELEGILSKRMADPLAFARGNYCLRVLGCPISDSGKPKVFEEQDGESARHYWDLYAQERDTLRKLYDEWREYNEW